MQIDLLNLGKSSPGTTQGGWELIIDLKPVLHQSGNLILYLIFIVSIDDNTSFDITSPLYIENEAINLFSFSLQLANIEFL